MSDKEAGKRIIHSAYEAKAIVAGLERYSALPDDYPGDAVQEAIIASIAAARPHILEEAAIIVDAMMNDAFSRSLNSKEPNRTGFRMRVETCRRIAAAIRAAKEG